MVQKKDLPSFKVLEKLKEYCVYQDRCHYDVQKKMYEFNLTNQEKDDILIELIQQNFLNEQRFTQSFIRGKFYQKKWGKIKIKHELKSRNIPEKLILSCFSEINYDDYLNVLKKLYQSKLGSFSSVTERKKHQKVFIYLISKGYEADLIKEIQDENIF